MTEETDIELEIPKSAVRRLVSDGEVVISAGKDNSVMTPSTYKIKVNEE